MSSNNIQFLQCSYADDATVKKRQKRVVHSNAARAAHAEARRLRTIKYQATKARERGQHLIHTPAEGVAPPVPQISRVLPASRTDPFQSFARPLEPIEHFLLDHFVTAVVPLLRCKELADFYRERMTKAWVPLALTDAGMLDSCFLVACRHLAVNYLQQQRQRFDELSTHYKLKCLQRLREEISSTISFKDATVAKTIMLVYDELSMKDTVMAKRHLDGALRMVDLNGGPQTLGLDGFIHRALSNLVQKFESGHLGWVDGFSQYQVDPSVAPARFICGRGQ